MDMEQLKRNIEESLEQIDLLTKEIDNWKDRYEHANVYIGKLKDKTDDLKFGKESNVQTSKNDEVGNIKKENEILKHDLKTMELKLSLKKDGSKSEPNMRSKNIDLRSQLSQIKFKLDSIKIENEKLLK